MHGHLSGWDPSVMWGSASQECQSRKSKESHGWRLMLLPSSQRSPLKLPRPRQDNSAKNPIKFSGNQTSDWYVMVRRM